MSKGSPWSDKEIATAARIYRRMVSPGAPASTMDRVWRTIGDAVGRKATAAAARFYNYGPTFVRVVGAGRIPVDVIADRDAREAAKMLRDRTAEFCGDPPPGYSALDRQRKSQQP